MPPRWCYPEPQAMQRHTGYRFAPLQPPQERDAAKPPPGEPEPDRQEPAQEPCAPPEPDKD